MPLTANYGLSFLDGEYLCQPGHWKRTLRFKFGNGCVGTRDCLRLLSLTKTISDGPCSYELASPVGKYVVGSEVA